MGMDPGAMGAYFQQERMWEKQIATKLLDTLKAIWVMRAGQDRQLVGLLKGVPPPPELFQTKVWLRYRMASARSRELKRVLAFIIKFIIKPLLDLFQPDPIMLDSYWKDRPTTRSERGVILAPGKPVAREVEPEEDVLKDQDIDAKETDNLIERPGGETLDKEKFDFVGPSNTANESGDEEEDMDM